MTVRTDYKYYVEVTVDYTVTTEKQVEQLAKLAKVGFYFKYYLMNEHTVKYCID